MDTPGAERRALDQPPSALAPAPEAHHAAHHLRRLLRRLRLCLGRLRLRENFGARCRGGDAVLYCERWCPLQYLTAVKEALQSRILKPKVQAAPHPCLPLPHTHHPRPLIECQPRPRPRAQFSRVHAAPRLDSSRVRAALAASPSFTSCPPISRASRLPIAATCPHRSLARLPPLRPNSPPRFFSHPLSPVVPRQMACLPAGA